MSDSLTLKIIDFITHLDSNVNPYEETALFINNQLKIPLPGWAKYLDRFLILPLLMIFFQAVHLIIFRIKKKKFYFFRMNYLGLIQTNISIHCSFGLGIYSLLSITSIALREFVLAGYDVHGWSDVILGTKSLLLLSASWSVSL
ncbi:hypothetical protein DFH28DRAFT_1077796 [Melampsora americana]|nr:hypothetical protein DFH28DRAFT_1077796 [Melampsora americana]